MLVTINIDCEDTQLTKLDRYLFVNRFKISLQREIHDINRTTLGRDYNDYFPQNMLWRVKPHT